MRIRSVRPEFWSSEDIARLNWHDRLIFIGLWSYVDDNGVGRDVERLIVADLFPLDEDLTEASLRVHGALKRLSAGGQITRYTVNGKRYLHVTTFAVHQVINRPSKGRYPLPTCDDAQPTPVPHGVLTEPSVPGEGEKGRRGEGEKKNSRPAELDGFDSWWKLYPRKEAKDAARKAYRSALRRASAQELHDGLRRCLPDLAIRERQYQPLPSTWLNAGRWQDGIDEQGALDLDPDAILGRDLWSLPAPPDGIEFGSPQWRTWRDQQLAAHREERLTQARAALARRTA